jgi:hypothetical protein
MPHLLAPPRPPSQTTLFRLIKVRASHPASVTRDAWVQLQRTHGCRLEETPGKPSDVENSARSAFRNTMEPTKPRGVSAANNR